MAAERWSAWQLSEAFHLAMAADYVVAAELLDEEERSADELAATAAVDPHILGHLLEFLCRRTDLVIRGPGGFRLGPGLGPVGCAVLDQYVGAYGRAALALPEILAAPDRGPHRVDRDRHARAFSRAPGPGAVLLPDLLRRLSLRAVLDVGCGSGDLLVTMARTDPGFVGWGVDTNPAMIRAAEQRAQVAGVGEQVRFSVTGPTDPTAGLPHEALAETTVVVAASMLNELLHPDTDLAVPWLRRLGEALPGRILVVVDYYGAGSSSEPSPRRALHDWVQVLSGQGVPPADLAGWESLYRSAGCQLLHALEDTRAGVFIHLLRLPAAQDAQ